MNLGEGTRLFFQTGLLVKEDSAERVGELRWISDFPCHPAGSQHAGRHEYAFTMAVAGSAGWRMPN